jgi:hypothetical protein
MRAKTLRRVALITVIDAGIVAANVGWFLSGRPWLVCLLFALVTTVTATCIWLRKPKP